jgi:uncharacterized protein (DUF2267 family)
VRAVLAVLRRAVGELEFSDIRVQLPEPYRAVLGLA